MEDKFKILIDEISKLIKPLGFVKKNNTFCVLTDNGNYGIINFQKSLNSSKAYISFTINIGVVSRKIRLFYGESIDNKLVIEDSHWKKRLGYILEYKKDHWWEINDATNMESLIKEVCDVVRLHSIPELMSHISDESLIKSWMNGLADGLTNLQRLFNLSILLKETKNAELINVIEELKELSKGKGFESTVKIHLKELEAYGN